MRVRLLLAFALVLLAGPASAARAAKRPRHPARTYVPTPENLGKVGGFSPGWTPLEACQERYRDAPLDHFSWAVPTQTYRQRYFFCPHFWEKKRDALAAAKRRRGSAKAQPRLRGVASLGADGESSPLDDLDAGFTKSGPPIFFYTGNEANVELYLNATGLMWEHAESFGAVLVFAEHRYYGESKSKPKPKEDGDALDASAAHASSVGGIIPGHLKKKGDYPYLTSEQAMADYATLIRELKAEIRAPDAPVFAFGGSYGGMLATWMRLKYANVVDGAVAGSAPVWSFVGEDPPVDPGAFADGVTMDATAAGGSPPACAPNVRAAFAELIRRSETDPKSIKAPMRLCDDTPLGKSKDVLDVALWAQGAFDYLAMGNFPYESSYILNGDGTLPPYPFRVACGGAMADPTLPNKGGDALLSALADAVGVYYNYSKTQECFDTQHGSNDDSDEDGELWDYQYCTEMFMPMSRDGVRDMFFPQPWNETDAVLECERRWGVRPKTLWATTAFGGKRLSWASNVVWTNGYLDPWAGLGVQESLSPSLVAMMLPGGAHHLDFMWSNDLDPEPVIEARKTQMRLLRQWILNKYRAVAARGETIAEL